MCLRANAHDRLTSSFCVYLYFHPIQNANLIVGKNIT